MNAYTNISEGLAAARADRNLGLREAARALDIAPTSIWRIETEQVKPTIEMVQALAALYRVNVLIDQEGVTVKWPSKRKTKTEEKVAA